MGQIKLEKFSTARKTRRTERTPQRTSQETPERAPTVVVIGDALSENSRTVKKRKNVLPIPKHSTTDAEDENESAGGLAYSRSMIYNHSSNDDQAEQADESRSSVTPLLFPQKTPRALFAEASHKPKAKLTFSKKKLTEEDGEDIRDRPFTLPSGQFKPKQSLGQNFLSDQNYVLKICDAFKDSSPDGLNVVEIGPGPGALTRVLYPRYPAMTAIEIDERAVAFLGEKLPGKRTSLGMCNYVMRHVLLATE